MFGSIIKHRFESLISSIRYCFYLKHKEKKEKREGERRRRRRIMNRAT